MNDQEITLPEKCCAKCGFLYGVTQFALGNLGTFDPDLVRLPSFDIEHANDKADKKEQRKVTSYSLRHFSETITDREILQSIAINNISSTRTVRDIESTEIKMFPIYWNEVESMNCLWNIFPAQKTAASEKNIADFLDLVRKNRSDCRKFYGYHPGFTAKEHAEIRLQEKREAVLDEYWERDNFRENVLGIITVVLTITSIILAYLYGAK